MAFRTGTHGRRAVRAAAVVAAAGAAVAFTVPAMAANAGRASHVLAAGQSGSRATVPWSKVGPGWALALYSASQGGEGVKPKAGPSTLYLVDPRGGRYSLFTWAARSKQTQWFLQGWSGDVKRALFTSEPQFGGGNGREHVYQLQLRTGAVTSFALPKGVVALSYTRPDGLNILAQKGTVNGLHSKVSLQRYNLAGQLQKKLATITYLGGTAYQSAGAKLAAGSLHGLELISNAGGIIKNLPVPGVKDGCSAVRWWSAGTILASCFVGSEPGPRMWLVPSGGARPTSLTPARHNNFDLGDFNAWKLSSGLYVNGYSACSAVVIGRQLSHGREQKVNVPGSASSLIVNATSSKLMVERINGCSPGISLVWFNPKTRALTVAIRVRHNQHGVSAVVPYFIAGKF